MLDEVNPSGVSRRHRGFRQLWLGALLVIGLISLANATSLFRWTDSEGRMHFGDRPPPAEVEHVDELNMPSFAAPSRPADQDPYSILNQLGRLQANRRNLERERQQRAWQEREYYLRKRELEALEQVADQPSGSPVYGYPRPVYPQRPIHRHGRPGHRPGQPLQRTPSRIDRWYEPDHPAYRPRPRPHPPAGVPPLPGGTGIHIRR